jgi:viral A-type inclusion protein, putative
MQKLTNYLKTSNPQVERFLENVYLSDNGLEYQDIRVVTDKNNPVAYIGEYNRQKAREIKRQELSNLIKENKQKDSDLKNNIGQIKNKIKALNELKEKLQSTQNSLKSLQKAFNQKQESLNTTKEKQTSLTASNNPLLAQLQNYSHTDYLKLVQQFEANQRLQKEHNQLSLRLEELNQERVSLADKNQELAIKLDSTTQEITDKQNAIEDLQSDEQFQDLKDKEEALTAVYNEEKARHLDLVRQYGSIETQLKSKNDEYNDLHSRQSEFQDALTQSKNIVNSIYIDEYSISEELQKIDTTEIQINSKTERLTFPDVPKSTFAKDLKQQLNSLTVTEIIDENGIAHSLKARMDSLQEAIDSANQNATTLLENNEKSLRLILRDQLKSVNEHVSENVDAFVANMNRSNPSHLQFSAKSSISDQGQAILNTLEDQEHYNNFFDQLQERIHQQLQNPDITPDDIIDYMLAEIEPRRWYDLAMFYERDNNQEIKPLTTQAINSFSTGERVRCYYIPMFALLEIVQSQMNSDAPRILLMDEAFAPVDNEQTALLLEKIYDLCDLFIATTPGKTLPIVSNSTGSTTLQLQRINLNGRPVVQSFGGPIYEEIA